jgi:mono/diheme cytochrome c family protein
MQRVSGSIRWLLIAGLIGLACSAHADDAAIGREIYHDNCAACHGKDMVSAGAAFDLRKFPRDEAARFRQSVRKGKPPAMPAWETRLSLEDVQALWDYIKSGG